MTLEKAIPMIQDSFDYLPAKYIEAITYVCNLAIKYSDMENELNEYKKQHKKIVNKNIIKAYQLMKESGYFDE